MENKIILIIKGNQLLSNTWRQELQIREDGVQGETLIVGKRVTKFLPYENIAQVNITKKILSADLEIINKGGAKNLVVKAIKKSDADKAKEVIDKKRGEVINNQKNQSQNNFGADELKKLAQLRDEGIITEEDFQNKKRQILGV